MCQSLLFDNKPLLRLHDVSMIKKRRSSNQHIQCLVVTTLLDTATNITEIARDVLWVVYLSPWHRSKLQTYGYSRLSVREVSGAGSARYAMAWYTERGTAN